MRRLLAFSALALSACSTTPTPLSIAITAGQEADAFTTAPAVTNVWVTVTSIENPPTVNLTRSATVGGTFDFGDIDNTEQVTVTVAGYAAGTAPGSGTPLMTGSSLSGLLLGSIVNELPVFIERSEQWSRPPGAIPSGDGGVPAGGLACSHVGGLATVLADRYLLLTEGKLPAGSASGCTASGVDGYDLFALGGTTTAAPFVPTPQTVISLLPSTDNPDTQVFLITDGAAGASFFDYATSESTSATLPTGLSAWSDITGGAVIAASDGRTFVVGGAQPDKTSAAVLEIDADGTLGAYSLNAPRRGAAVLWIDSVGLVVAGGSATAPGVEVLLDNGTATTFVNLAYPPDDTVGAAAATASTTDDGFVLFGGVSGGAPKVTRTLAASCTEVQCSYTPVPAATLPLLQNAGAYQLVDGRYVVVGTDAMGMTSSFIVDFNQSTVTPAPLREPRKGAVQLPAPNGSLAIFGGEHPDGTPALSVELLVP